MNKTQAMAALRKLFGTKAMWRYDERAPVGEEREAIKATLEPLAQANAAAKEARDARRRELLQDPQYRQLVVDAEAADKAHREALGRWRHRRVTVGRDAGIAFHVVAEGDNWQDAIDAARAAEGKK